MKERVDKGGLITAVIHSEEKKGPSIKKVVPKETLPKKEDEPKISKGPSKRDVTAPGSGSISKQKTGKDDDSDDPIAASLKLREKHTGQISGVIS